MSKPSQEEQSHFCMGKISKDIKVEVECDYVISKNAYLKVFESLLKYILYQCHQIPVQVEVLQREIQNWKHNSYSEGESIQGSIGDNSVVSNFSYSGNVREEIKERLCQRRKEQALQSYERKRKKWLSKVDNFLTCFNSAVTMLQEELDKSVVSSVIFMVGNSPSLAKAVFKIDINSCLPTVLPYYNGKRNLSSSFDNNFNIESLERKILLGLFRAFAANDELSKFINGHFATSKIWLFLHKQPHHEDKTDMGLNLQIDNALIPQIYFKIPRRAKVVDIVLNEISTHFNNDIVDMELTPCIDSKVLHTNNFKSAQVNTFCDRKKIKISLFPNICNIVDQHSCTYSSCDNIYINSPIKYDNRNPDFEHFYENGDTNVIQNKTNKLSDSTVSHLPETPCVITNPHQRISQNNYIYRIDEPPVSSVIEVTPSPVKLLSKNIDSLHFEESCHQLKEFVWYQYPICIKGFKDLYLQKK